MNPINIKATTLPDAWFRSVYKCLEVGKDFIIGQGSYEGEKRLEFDYITIHIKKPGARPLLPKIPEQYNLPDPVEEDYLNEYMLYLMTGELKKGESYTYGSRLCNAEVITTIPTEIASEKYIADIWKEIPINEGILSDGYKFINQIELFIWEYKNKGLRSNQRILQIAETKDCVLKDPPCLRHIDTRIQNNKLHFFPYFRSWDLWGGFPANLAAIQNLKEYMASEIGVEDGEMIVSSKGLHLYDYVWELAECIRGKTIQEFRNGQQ